MRLGDIYQLAVEVGIEADPRGREQVERLLKKSQEDYNLLPEKDKRFFELEKFSNPYSDTRILYGDEDRPVENILVGIDMEVGEVLLADRLRERGEKVELILAHHPEGKAMAQFYEVMHLQEDVLAQLGVPINVAEGLLSSRIGEVRRGVMPVNHYRAVDAARWLDLPFMCCHTPADNLVTRFLTDLFQREEPYWLGQVVDLLLEQPEYIEAAQSGAGPAIILGDKKKRAGKIFVDMTGGTSGSEDAYSKLVQAGVGTIVGMHMGEKHRKEAEKNHINVIIAGHMASDSLGINLFLDHLIQQEPGIALKPCSGFRRVERVK